MGGDLADTKYFSIDVDLDTNVMGCGSSSSFDVTGEAGSVPVVTKLDLGAGILWNKKVTSSTYNIERFAGCAVMVA